MDWVTTLGQLLKAVFLFAMVIGLAYLSTRFLGTRLGGQVRGRHLRVLEQVALGRDRSLLLLEVAGKVYLISSDSGSTRRLAVIDEPERIAAVLGEAEQGPGARPAPQPFSALLGGLLKSAGKVFPLANRTPAIDPDAPLREQVDRLKRLARRSEGS